ncbi:MAG TPA: molybdopterin molybdenumtransferase MoeA [Gammaproteobacteria bacterium]|nr:molybdopterin molybdenumtransferase MoeA [Gammaproteobacteria bacterium]
MKDSNMRNLSFDEARAILLNSVSKAVSTESIELSEAVGRILAIPLIAPFSLPRFTQSAMDGYAVISEGAQHVDTPLTVVGKSLAGHPYSGELAAHECVRITTGAPMPRHADAVIVQENTRTTGQQIVCLQAAGKGDNIRLKGEECAAGDTLLGTGVLLNPAHIGLFATFGENSVSVYKKLRVAIFTTGDELKSTGESLTFGTQFNSNGPALAAYLKQFPVDLVTQQHLPDNYDIIKQSLIEASRTADLIISSGGVSVGEADYVHQVLQEVGQLSFWKVAIKPGKPFAFGQIGRTQFFALPGNPVSSLLTLKQLAEPAVVKMSGGQPKAIYSAWAVSNAEIKPNKSRLDFQRGIAFKDTDGKLLVTPVEKQSSAMLTSLIQANCLIWVPPGKEIIPVGTRIEIEWLNW